MKKDRHWFPRGWDEKRVRAVIDYYENQTEDEAAAEIETADEAPGQTWISVPTELVPAIARLIDDHARQAAKRRVRNGRTTKRPSKKSAKSAKR
jgi:hypothetical protein